MFLLFGTTIPHVFASTEPMIVKDIQNGSGDSSPI